MKKVVILTIALILVLAMTITLTACGETDTAPIATPPPAAEPTPTPTPEPTPEIEPVHESEPETQQDLVEELIGFWNYDGTHSDYLSIFEDTEWVIFSHTENGEGILELSNGELFEWKITDEGYLLINTIGDSSDPTPFLFKFELRDRVTLLFISNLDPWADFVFSREADTTMFDSIRGVVDGHTYKSEYLGFSITIPDDWEILDIDEFSAWDEYGSALGSYTIHIRFSQLGTTLEQSVQDRADWSEVSEDKVRIGNYYWYELVRSDDNSMFTFAESSRRFFTGDIDRGILIEMEIIAVEMDVEIAVMKNNHILSLFTPYP